MVEQAFLLVRHPQRIGKGFLEPGVSMWPFAKRPSPGFLEVELSEKILVQRPIDIARNGMITGGSEPVLPDRHATVATAIDMPLVLARDSATNFEHLGLALRKTIRQFDPDFKLGNRPFWRSDNTPLMDEEATFDSNCLAGRRSVQLRLIESDRRSDIVQRKKRAVVSQDLTQGFD